MVMGLGNPGGEYARTRHNVGWMCLEELERRGRFGGSRRVGEARVREGSVRGVDLITARPLTYMNDSGRAALHLTRTHGVPMDDVVVVHDDVDLPLGTVRLKHGGGAAGHKGVASLIASWRTQDFTRVRVGVGRPPDRQDMIDHVLDSFTPGERAQLPAVIATAADAVLDLATLGVEAAMEKHNRRPRARAEAAPPPGPSPADRPGPPS